MLSVKGVPSFNPLRLFCIVQFFYFYIRFLIAILWIAIPSIIFVLSHRIIRGKCRNNWNLQMDLAIQMMQWRRGKYLKTVHRLRERLDRLVDQPPIKGIRVEKLRINRENGTTMAVEWLVPENAVSDKVILYFHGGGFCLCSANTHRPMVSQIAKETNMSILLFNYRRSPEHKYPSQIEDGLTAYRWLRSDDCGIKAKDIIFAGDSAGGNLVLSTALYLKHMKEEMPCSLVTLSPWTDLTNSSDTWKTNFHTDFLPYPEMMQEWSRYYVPAGMSLKNPYVSPAFADLSGLPPLLIQVSDKEQLYEDSLKLLDQAKTANLDVTIEIFNNMPHVFHVFGGELANSAIKSIAKWIASK
jgi:acetyl esterase/lipase